MKMCEKTSKNKCAKILQLSCPLMIKYLVALTPIVNKRILDKNANALIRETNAIKHELKIVEEKIGKQRIRLT